MRLLTKILGVFAVCAPVVIGGCAHRTISGTTIPDTKDNRAVYDVLGELELAMRARDANRILQLVSRSYFEDMGTPNPEDDYGYKELSERVLPGTMSVTAELYLTMDIYEIVVSGNRAHADIRYASRARVELPSGDLWDTHKEFNRLELSREDSGWRIISGL